MKNKTIVDGITNKCKSDKIRYIAYGLWTEYCESLVHTQYSAYYRQDEVLKPYHLI